MNLWACLLSLFCHSTKQISLRGFFQNQCFVQCFAVSSGPSSSSVLLTFSRCLKGPLSLSPTYGTMHCIKIHTLFTHRRAVCVSMSCALTGILNVCPTDRLSSAPVPLQPQRTEDSGFPHRTAAAAQRHFCFWGVASNFALWLAWTIIFYSAAPRPFQMTQSASRSQRIVQASRQVSLLHLSIIKSFILT